MMKSEHIHPGMRFSHGNVSFTVIQKKKGVADTWTVRAVVPGAFGQRHKRNGHKQVKPIEMHSAKILEFAGEYNADSVISQMATQSTINGERRKASTTRERLDRLSMVRAAAFRNGFRHRHFIV
jgi:hypothetical protein